MEANLCEKTSKICQFIEEDFIYFNEHYDDLKEDMKFLGYLISENEKYIHIKQHHAGNGGHHKHWKML